jgi:hypothetical protein
MAIRVPIIAIRVPIIAIRGCAGVVWTALDARACTTARVGTGCTLSVSQQAAPTLRSQMRSCRWGSGGSRGGSAAVTEPRTSVPAALRGHPAASFLASGPSHLRGYPAASFRLKGFDSGTERVAHRGTHGRSAATPPAGRSCSGCGRSMDSESSAPRGSDVMGDFVAVNRSRHPTTSNLRQENEVVLASGPSHLRGSAR